ncbi:MAG TPA: hypothetical protein VKY39_08980 [Aggregatilineales bacterium]|nr:hypothetical protein [Aggregatilineales bacterium]
MRYRNASSNCSIARLLVLALAAGLLLAGCGNRPADAADSGTPAASSTPWPTLAAVVPASAVTPGPAGTPDEAASETPEATGTLPPQSGPELIDQFRTQVRPGLLSVFPLEGDVEHPVRIEVIVLSGDLNPLVVINNMAGDRLAVSNSGGQNEPEVIGQFLFPADGFYELGVSAGEGEGEVGVSIYRLDPAELEGGGTLESIDASIRGVVAHPSTYHTIRLQVERGQRFDLGAEALTAGLDLLFELYGPDGALLAARDDNVDQDPWLWNFMPNVSGEYTIVLSNYGETTGEYRLQVSPSEGGEPATLGARTEVAVQGAPRRSTWLTFDGTALDAIYVEAQPIDEGVDVQVAVYDAYGNELISVNDAGTGAGETIALMQFPFDGHYQIEFSTLGESGVVEYYIRYYRFTELEDDTGGMVVAGGFGKSGELADPNMAVTYLFDANQGDLVGVDAHATGSSGLDLGFDLYGPDGTRLARRDDVVGKNPVIDGIELPLSGRYALTLWNYGGSTGTYDVFVTNPGVPATPPGESLDFGEDAAPGGAAPEEDDDEEP